MQTLTRPTPEYYAFSGLPYEAFERVDAIYALFYAITDIPQQVTEPSIAHQKCMFYLQDICKIPQKQAIHPLCSALQNTNPNPWQDIVTATQMDIDGITQHDEIDFKRYAHKKYGALYRLIAETLNIPLQYSNELGYCVAQAKRSQMTQEPMPVLPKPFNVLYRLYQDMDATPLKKLLISRFYDWIG